MCGDMTWNDDEANNCSDAKDGDVSPVTVGCRKGRRSCELVVDAMELLAPLCVHKTVDPVGDVVFHQSVNHQLCY
jgi:hypothetical protein